MFSSWITTSRQPHGHIRTRETEGGREREGERGGGREGGGNEGDREGGREGGGSKGERERIQNFITQGLRF